MINKHKLHLIALVSAALILMLTCIVSAAPFAYITNFNDNTVSVIDTANTTITATVPVGLEPYGVAVSSDGTKVYVTNSHDDPGDISIIDTAT